MSPVSHLCTFGRPFDLHADDVTCALTGVELRLRTCYDFDCALILLGPASPYVVTHQGYN